MVSERHRHRWEFNPRYRSRFDDGDFCCSGVSPDGRLVEFIELASHPYWVGTQAHPEFKSRPERPAPLFLGLVRAALAHADERAGSASAAATDGGAGHPAAGPSAPPPGLPPAVPELVRR